MALDPLDSDGAFPRLGEDIVALLAAAGERRAMAAGEILVRAGDPVSDFFVILDGAVAVIDGYGSAVERVVGVHGEKRFAGELNLVTRQPACLTAIVEQPGAAIVLSRDQLQDVVSANQQLGDVIVNALIARRSLLIGRATGLRLIGSHLAPDSRRLREFLTRNRIPHTFLDLETDAQANQLLDGLSIAPRETPLLLGGSIVLRNPSNAAVAEALHLRTATACDVVVVGAGPAGLGTAVYAASEERRGCATAGPSRWSAAPTLPARPPCSSPATSAGWISSCGAVTRVRGCRGTWWRRPRASACIYTRSSASPRPWGKRHGRAAAASIPRAAGRAIADRAPSVNLGHAHPRVLRGPRFGGDVAGSGRRAAPGSCSSSIRRSMPLPP